MNVVGYQTRVAFGAGGATRVVGIADSVAVTTVTGVIRTKWWNARSWARRDGRFDPLAHVALVVGADAFGSSATEHTPRLVIVGD